MLCFSTTKQEVAVAPDAPSPVLGAEGAAARGNSRGDQAGAAARVAAPARSPPRGRGRGRDFSGAEVNAAGEGAEMGNEAGRRRSGQSASDANGGDGQQQRVH